MVNSSEVGPTAAWIADGGLAIAAGRLAYGVVQVLWAAVPTLLLLPVELTNDRQTERAELNSGHRDHVYPNPVRKRCFRS